MCQKGKRYFKAMIALYVYFFLCGYNTSITLSQENVVTKVQAYWGSLWDRPIGLKSLRSAKQLASLLPSSDRLITLKEENSDTLYRYIAKRLDKIKNEKELKELPVVVRTICVFTWNNGAVDTLYMGPTPIMALNSKYYHLDFWLLHRICKVLPESEMKRSILDFIREYDLPEELKKY